MNKLQRMLIGALVICSLAVGSAVAEESETVTLKKLKKYKWSNVVVQEYINELPEKQQRRWNNMAENMKKNGRDVIHWKVAQAVALRYKGDGGVLQPYVDGRIWFDSKPQAICSLGAISYCNSIAEAKAISGKTGKPIMGLHTETPG